MLLYFSFKGLYLFITFNHRRNSYSILMEGCGRQKQEISVVPKYIKLENFGS